MFDPDGEYTEDEELHRAVIGYSIESDRRLRLMHDTSVEVGTWVELARLPGEMTIDLTVPGEKAHKVKLPAGAVVMGIVWTRSRGGT